MRQARATRYYAEANGGSSSVDLVQIDTVDGSFEMGYTAFVELFGLEIRKGREIAFAVKATVIPEASCKVPR